MQGANTDRTVFIVPTPYLQYQAVGNLFTVVVHVLQWVYTCYSGCTRVTVGVHVLQWVYTCYSGCTRVTVVVHVLQWLYELQWLYTCYSGCTRVTVGVRVMTRIITTTVGNPGTGVDLTLSGPY